ncbi:MAG: oxidoreductase [Motilibacteraceae bacterium]
MTSAPPDPLAAVASLPGAAEAAERARGAVDALLAHRVLRRSFAAVTVECSLRAAVAAADLQQGRDGGPDLDEVRAQVRAGALFTPEADTAATADRALAALRGALRVSAEVGPLLPTWERAPLQALARLHVVAAADVLPADVVGRPRPPGAMVADALELGPAPVPAEVAQRLDGLAGLLVAPTRAPALVVAAVVHAEVLALRPFAWGNVLVALAAQRMVLAGRGLDPRAVAVPEAGHLELGVAAYVDALRGYLAGTPQGVAGWVVHCARALEIGAREGLAVCETVARAAGG